MDQSVCVILLIGNLQPISFVSICPDLNDGSIVHRVGGAGAGNARGQTFDGLLQLPREGLILLEIDLNLTQLTHGEHLASSCPPTRRLQA